MITSKDVYMLTCIKNVEPDIPLPSDNLLIYNSPKSKDAGWEKWLYDKHKDFYVTGADISASPSDFILSFSYWDITNLNDIKPNGGLYLYSSSEPFTEEQQIDMDRLVNWINRYKLELRGIYYENEEWHIEPGYHCSGHVTRNELEEIIREINPENLIPVHTMNRTWFSRFEDISNVI